MVIPPVDYYHHNHPYHPETSRSENYNEIYETANLNSFLLNLTSARKPEIIDETDDNCDAKYNTFKRKQDGNLKYSSLNGIKPKELFLRGNILLHTKRE